MSQDQFLNLQPGTIVNGRYEIVRCLGTGSMGMVYACRHRELSGHLVAMKVLFAEVARDAIAAARFRNEIVASYGVSHPNVVRAYEYFRDGDLIAFTMEYIEGGDLADRINAEEPLEISQIVQMLAQMCSGVQAIHDAGIVHRDLKPENILITSNKDIKITDFGIARTGTGPKLTEHGGVVGTLDYVSPEYLEKGQVDARSDIYALGVLAYEMLTSESPFKGKSVIETMTMRLRTDPEPPHILREECPAPLSDIVLKAMKRNPDERYQSASEVLQDLQSLGTYSLPSFGSGHYGAIPKGMGTSVPEPEYREVKGQDRPEAKGSPSGHSTAGPTPSAASSEERIPDTLETYSLSSSASMESVLGGPEEFTVSKFGEGSNPRVSVSDSHLSAQRIRELSSDFYLEEESLLNKAAVWLLIIVIGFGVGFFFLKSFEPELFSGGAQTPKISDFAN